MANSWCPWTLPFVGPTPPALGRRAATNCTGCRACSMDAWQHSADAVSCCPPPMVVADSWFSDSKLMRHIATTHQGTFLVEGKSTYTFALPDGRQVKGHDLQQDREWLWRS